LKDVAIRSHPRISAFAGNLSSGRTDFFFFRCIMMRVSWNKLVTACLVLALLCILPANNPAVYADTSTNNGSAPIYMPLIYNSEPVPDVPVGPSGGSYVALANDVIDTNIVYAGSWGAGVYVSYDHGNNWYVYNTGMGNQYIDSLAVDPTQKGVVYAGTQGNGIFKSTNGGRNWFPIDNGIQSSAVVYSLAVNYGNNNIIYAGTRYLNIPNVNGPYNGILYRSMDGGAHWSAVLQNISAAQDWIYSIAADPTVPTRIFATSHEHGPYVSVDNGATFTSISHSGIDTSGRAVAVDPRPAKSGTVFYSDWHGYNVYKTTDAGATWKSVAYGPRIYPNGINIAITQPEILYFAEYYGDDSNPQGKVWKFNSATGVLSHIGLDNHLIYCVAASRTDANTVVAGTRNKGIYTTTNGGGTWTLANSGVANTQVAGVAFAGGKIYMAVYGLGVYSSQDAGQTWQEDNEGLDDLQINALTAAPDGAHRLLVATNSGLYTLDLNGGAWQRSPDGVQPALQSANTTDDVAPYGAGHPFTLPVPDAVADASGALQAAESPRGAALSLAFAPSDANIAYLGEAGAGIFASQDGGVNWAQASLDGETVWSLAVDPANAQHVYASLASSASVFESMDGGKTWTELAIPDPGISVVYTLADENGQLSAGTNNGLWKLSGGVWQAEGLSGLAVTTLTAAQQGKALVAGTTAGAFQSTNGGATWQTVDANLNGTTIRALAADPANPNSVYLGTTVRGAYRASLQAAQP
jgi:photosystem II stability/assembly factor-like uncharacterized protein